MMHSARRFLNHCEERKLVREFVRQLLQIVAQLNGCRGLFRELLGEFADHGPREDLSARPRDRKRSIMNGSYC